MSTQRRRVDAVFWGVAVVSLCVMMLQITLTRLFSATMHYHYAFLAISLALFGSGAGGVLVYLSGEPLDDKRACRPLAYSALLFALTTVIALFVVLHCPLQPQATVRETFVRLHLRCQRAPIPVRRRRDQPGRKTVRGPDEPPLSLRPLRRCARLSASCARKDARPPGAPAWPRMATLMRATRKHLYCYIFRQPTSAAKCGVAATRSHWPT